MTAPATVRRHVDVDTATYRVRGWAPGAVAFVAVSAGFAVAMMFSWWTIGVWGVGVVVAAYLPVMVAVERVTSPFRRPGLELREHVRVR